MPGASRNDPPRVTEIPVPPGPGTPVVTHSAALPRRSKRPSASAAFVPTGCVRADALPLVYQWNKRDSERALATKLLEAQLNPRKAPSLEAVAVRGEGVWETERQILALTLKSLRRSAGEPEAA